MFLETHLKSSENIDKQGIFDVFFHNCENSLTISCGDGMLLVPPEERFYFCAL